MAIEFRCQCGATHSADDSMAGRTFRCDACGQETVVPEAQVAAADLVAQMRAAREETGAGGPASLGEMAGALSKAGPKAGSSRPNTARQRAATHLGFKRVMWVPALVVGVLCLVFAVWAFAGSFTVRYPDVGVADPEIVVDEQGRAWAIDPSRPIRWDEKGDPFYTQGEWDIEPPARGERFLEAKGRARGFILFGVALLVVGGVLVFLSLWMRRDVHLAAEAAPQPGAPVE